MIICLQVLCVSSVFLSLLLDMAFVMFWCFHHHAFVTCFAMILCIRWNSTIDLMLHLLRGKSTFVFLMQHLNEQTPHYQYGSKIESKNHSMNVFVKHCFVRFSSINEQISTQEDIKFANPSIPPIFLTKVPLLSYWTASVTQGYFQKEFIVMATACLHHRREMNHLVSPPHTSLLWLGSRAGGALSYPANQASDSAAGCQTNIRLWQSYTHRFSVLCPRRHTTYTQAAKNHTLMDKSVQGHKYIIHKQHAWITCTQKHLQNPHKSMSCNWQNTPTAHKQDTMRICFVCPRGTDQHVMVLTVKRQVDSVFGTCSGKHLLIWKHSL